MKAKIFKVTGLSLIAASALLITGCTADFEEANRPGDKTSSEELGRDNYSTGSFLVQMQNEAFPEQENTYQMNQDSSATTWAATSPMPTTASRATTSSV